MKIHLFTPARLIYDSLDSAKSSLKTQIEGAKLISDVEAAAREMGGRFDAAIAAEVKAAEESNGKIEEENKTIRNPKDKKPLADIAALEKTLLDKKATQMEALGGVIDGKKIALTQEAKQAAERLAGEVAQTRLDAEQTNRRKGNPASKAEKIFADAKLERSDFNATEDIHDEDFTWEHWSQDDTVAATKGILQAIYIEQGEEAALAKAKNLKERWEGKDVFDLDEEDLAATFGDGPTGIDFEKDDPQHKVMKENAEADLTGLVYGFYYTSGDTFKGNDELIDSYRSYLRDKADILISSLEEAGEDAGKRQAILAKIQSPSQWAMDHMREKFQEVKQEKEEGAKEMKDYQDAEEYTRSLVKSISNVELRDRMQNILIGIIGSSGNKEDWPVMAEQTLKSMGVDPKDIGNVSADILNKWANTGDFEFGDFGKGEIDPWIEEYTAGLLTGANEYWKNKKFYSGGKETDFVDAYKKYLEQQFKGNIKLALEVAGRETDKKDRDRRIRLWKAVRKNVLTPSAFFKDNNSPPETHEKGYTLIDQDGQARMWDGDKWININDGYQRETSDRKKEVWNQQDRQWKPVAKPVQRRAVASGGSRPGGTGTGGSPGTGGGPAAAPSAPASGPGRSAEPVAKPDVYDENGVKIARLPETGVDPAAKFDQAKPLDDKATKELLNEKERKAAIERGKGYYATVEKGGKKYGVKVSPEGKIEGYFNDRAA